LLNNFGSFFRLVIKYLAVPCVATGSIYLLAFAYEVLDLHVDAIEYLFLTIAAIPIWIVYKYLPHFLSLHHLSVQIALQLVVFALFWAVIIRNKSLLLRIAVCALFLISSIGVFYATLH
jgi:hypothetical protein